MMRSGKGYEAGQPSFVRGVRSVRAGAAGYGAVRGVQVGRSGGPQDAPSGKDPVVPIPAEVARRLAYYSAGGTGVLGSRGWSCLDVYGSGGDILYLTPRPIDTVTWFSTKRAGFTGPVIELAFSRGESAERPEAGADKVTYKSTNVVEFETAAREDGPGTRFWVRKSDTPIRGAVMRVGDTPDLLLLSVRLPPDAAGLTSTIIQQVEREAATVPH
jgi:hypothetical protein